MLNDENKTPGKPPSPSLQRLVEEDAVGQLRRGEGQMAALGSEDGALKLDWVEGVARLLADNTKLEEVEEEARAMWGRGVRHVIWAGMGGSVITVHVLHELGFCSGHNGERIAVYPLDSTDPAALNAIVHQILQAKDRTPTARHEFSDPVFLRELFTDVMMVGVSMGMTSEEPITHLTWFADLLEKAQLSPSEHVLIMTLPGSYLDAFAHERQVPSVPLQLDGRTGTGGRMSAPTTRVFLLPVALYLTRLSAERGQLRAVLRQAWQEYNLEQAAGQPAEHPFVQLAAVLSEASVEGVCRLLIYLPEYWRPIVPWIEQLMEESLGKDGKGVIVFAGQPLNIHGSCYRASGTLDVYIDAHALQPQGEHVFVLPQASLARSEPLGRLAALAANFLGWQLSMALYGYLQNITFAGQPAVENYKARARVLRNEQDPLRALSHEHTAHESVLTLFGLDGQSVPAEAFANKLQVIQAGHEQNSTSHAARLDYLDLTINGEVSNSWLPALHVYTHRIANDLLGVPVKLRRAPAAYHSTEQSEMDGSPYFVSLRLLARDHEDSIVGSYSDTFLRAQAVSTWQAMVEQGRQCYLLVAEGSAGEVLEPLENFFHAVAAHIAVNLEKRSRRSKKS